MARERNIDLKRNETLKKEGGVGKQKGLLQVLWERGWIDESNLQEYQDFSLDVLMASCLDFANEIPCQACWRRDQVCLGLCKGLVSSSTLNFKETQKNSMNL
jgi:hypothetical protein